MKSVVRGVRVKAAFSPVRFSSVVQICYAKFAINTHTCATLVIAMHVNDVTFQLTTSRASACSLPWLDYRQRPLPIEHGVTTVRCKTPRAAANCTLNGSAGGQSCNRGAAKRVGRLAVRSWCGAWAPVQVDATSACSPVSLPTLDTLPTSLVA